MQQEDKDRFKETSKKQGTKVKEFQPRQIKNPSKKEHLNEKNKENGKSVQSKGERNVSYPSSNKQNKSLLLDEMSSAMAKCFKYERVSFLSL